jgi:hypothetical protein
MRLGDRAHGRRRTLMDDSGATIKRVYRRERRRAVELLEAAIKNALKISRGHPIDCLVNFDDLSDEQIWAICLAIMPGLRDREDYLMLRDSLIDLERKVIERLATIDALEYFERQLRLAGEHKLAKWMRRLRLERAKRSTDPWAAK